MRFLQTEWHRHERDRNAWEIEKQEMKSRIAALEGQSRRSDNTQRTLKKYVAILEKKVKEQAAQLKAGANRDDEADKPKLDRAALIQEKLRGKNLLAPHCRWCIVAMIAGSRSVTNAMQHDSVQTTERRRRARRRTRAAPPRRRVWTERPQELPRPVPS